jgi:hypothetical protein
VSVPVQLLVGEYVGATQSQARTEIKCFRYALGGLRHSGLQCAKFRRGFRYGRQNANGSKRRGTNTSSRPRDRPESTHSGHGPFPKADITVVS